MHCNCFATAPNTRKPHKRRVALVQCTHTAFTLNGMLHLCGALKPVATAVNHTGGQKSPGCTCTVHFDCAATGNYALHLLDALWLLYQDSNAIPVYRVLGKPRQRAHKSTRKSSLVGGEGFRSIRKPANFRARLEPNLSTGSIYTLFGTCAQIYLLHASLHFSIRSNCVALRC